MENHSLFIAPFSLFCFVLFKPSPHPLMDPGCLVMVSPERPEMVIPADSPCDIASLFLFGAVGKEEKEKEKKRRESERKKKETRESAPSTSTRPLFFFFRLVLSAFFFLVLQLCLSG